MSPGRSGWPGTAYNQKAVWWTGGTIDGFSQRSYDPGVEIYVRWQKKIRTIVGEGGREVVSRAEVLTDSEVQRGDYLWRGELADLDSDQVVDPTELSEAFEVAEIEESASPADSAKVVRKALL